jgi:hypothetical protein
VVSILVVASVLAVNPPAPVKLASPGLSGLNLAAEELEFYSEHLAQQLSLTGLQVTTAKQISQLLGLERQKQLLGCTENSSSCMAELASALGMDGVVTGSVGKFEKSYRVNVSIIAASDGRTLAVYSARAATSEELLEGLTTGAQQMAAEAVRGLRGEAGVAALRLPRPRAVPGPQPAATSGLKLRPYFWAPAAGGVVLGAVGTVFAVQAKGHFDDLRSWRDASVPVNYADSAQSRAQGSVAQLWAMGLYAGAGLAVAGAVVMFLTGSPEAPGGAAEAAPAAVRVAPGPGGVTLTWSWP